MKTNRYAWISLTYLVFTLFWSARVVTFSWPGNPFARPLYDAQSQIQRTVEVTRTSVTALRQAGEILSRLPEPADRSSLTIADYATLQRQIAIAQIFAPPPSDTPRSALPANPRDWTARQRATAAILLSDAEKKLDSRIQDLKAVPPPEFWFVLCPWALPQPQTLKPCPPLTTTESAQLDQLARAEITDASKLASQRRAGDPSRHLFGSPELELFVLFAALGAFGASAHSIASVAMYLGKDRFVASWFAFYLTRPLIGGALGPLFYFVLRGGLFGEKNTWEDVNLFGYGAVALLVGFCASEALENLRDIAAAFFRGKGKKDALDGSTPVINVATVTPDPVIPPRPATETLALVGQNFVPASIVLVGGKPQTQVAFLPLNTLKVTLPLSPTPRTPYRVQICNPGPGGGQSEQITV